MGNDLRFAVRTLRRSPTFSIVAILVLALGIGANTAMFSVVHAVLLQSLPYEKPQQLVQLWMRFTGIGIPKDQNWVSAPEFTDLRQHSKAFSHLAAISSDSFNIRAGDKPERLEGAAVSASFFSLLGVKPAIGRDFTAAEETPGRDTVAIISDGLWRRRFGADANLPGTPLVVNGRSYLIAGVMPPGFQYPEGADIWVPLAFKPDDLSPNNRGSHGLLVIARIRDGVSLDAARTDMARVSEQVIEGAPNYPYKRYGFRVLMNPLLEEMVGDIRPALLLLMGAVTFVLLIAASNVANLLLARAAAREREFAVRTALGAGRWQLMRQLLTETALLSLLGAIFGVLLAFLSLRALMTLAETVLPRLTQAQLNIPVLAFTALVSLLTGVLFGLWPALRESSGFRAEALKEGGRGGTSGQGRLRLRSGLVVAEVTLSLILLAGAGLLIRSFLRLQQVDPGFRTDNVLTFRISPPETRYNEPAQARVFFRELSRRLKELPGVLASGGVNALPLGGSGSSGTTTVDTQAVSPDQRSPEADWRPVTPGFFEALRIGLVRGRYFEESDSETGNPVAIVDETMAMTFWPNEDAVGKRIKLGGQGSPRPWMTIVGVVRHVRYRTLESPSRVQIYWPEAQNPWPSLSFALRTTTNPKSLAKAVETTVQSIDPDIPIYSVRTMDEVMTNSTARRKLSMLLLAIFAGVALVLAAVGVYGVMSYAVEQRMREFGIRMALGASRSQLLGMVLGRSFWLVVCGVAAGLAGSVALMRLMRDLLFNVRPSDPVTYAVVSAGLLAVGLLAGYVPARRATRVEPVAALREE